MGSINISITEDVYTMLKRLKRGDESFSQIIAHLILEKDISRCYGLLSNRKEEMDTVEREAMLARRSKFRKAEQ